MSLNRAIIIAIWAEIPNSGTFLRSIGGRLLSGDRRVFHRQAGARGRNAWNGTTLLGSGSWQNLQSVPEERTTGYVEEQSARFVKDPERSASLYGMIH